MINVFGRSVGAPSNFTRLILLSALSVALMILDHRGHHLEKIRAGLNVLAYPIQLIASVPAYVGGSIGDFFTTRGTLRQDNEKLLAERQGLNAKVQQFDALEEENARLRRMLVFGTGDPDTLKVPYLTSASDIKEGDLLVSSGMGGTFPPGYPVAQVSRIVNDPNEAFLAIAAKPAAQLNHGKQVMLIWRGAAPKSGASAK